MNVSYQFPVFNPYNKATLEIFISGCRKKCKDCHNPELRDFKFGEPLNILELKNMIRIHKDFIKVISFTGGEPLDSNKGLYTLVQELQKEFKDLNLEWWLFTGKDLDVDSYYYGLFPKEEKKYAWIFNCFDKVKYGHYDSTKVKSGFPASSNQRVWSKESMW